MSVGALCVSALCIAMTCGLANVARRLVQAFVRQPFVKLLFEEGIAAAELCGSCFELIIVADNFGVSTYALFLFVLTMWWGSAWGDATACPYTHMEDIVEGRCDVRKALFKIWAEVTGGVLVFRYVQLYWGVEMVWTHEGRAFDDCTADLQVPMVWGALIECIATLLCRIASRALADSGLSFAPMLDSFISTSLVVAAFNYSGGYFNPVLATSLKYGCAGNTFTEHMVVYWIGASCGAVLSTYVYALPEVKAVLFTTTTTKRE